MGADPMMKPTQIASWDEMGWGELRNNAELFHAEKNPHDVGAKKIITGLLMVIDGD